MNAELHVLGTKALLRALPKNQDEIILAALKTKPLLAVAELIECLYGHDPEGGPERADNGLRVLIWRLRQRGIQIKARWGFGYSLVTTDTGKAR